MKRLGTKPDLQIQNQIDRHAQELFTVIGELFCRLAQVDLSNRCEFRMTPSKGTCYVAGVRATVARLWAGPRETVEFCFEAEGPSPNEAAEALRAQLVAKLRERIKSDVGALELAGFPFDWSEGYGKRVPHGDGTIDAEGYEQPPIACGTFALGDAFDPTTGRIIKNAKTLPRAESAREMAKRLGPKLLEREHRDRTGKLRFTYELLEDGTVNNCALKFGEPADECQVCRGDCPQMNRYGG